MCMLAFFLHDHVRCRTFLNLLGDESNAVRVEVMASLVQTLDQFCIANEEARTRAFADFLPALLAADAGCGYCWRIHHHLMLAFPHFVHMFTSDEVGPFLKLHSRHLLSLGMVFNPSHSVTSAPCASNYTLTSQAGPYKSQRTSQRQVCSLAEVIHWRQTGFCVGHLHGLKTAVLRSYRKHMI